MQHSCDPLALSILAYTSILCFVLELTNIAFYPSLATLATLPPYNTLATLLTSHTAILFSLQEIKIIRNIYSVQTYWHKTMKYSTLFTTLAIICGGSINYYSCCI